MQIVEKINWIDKFQYREPQERRVDVVELTQFARLYGKELPYFVER